MKPRSKVVPLHVQNRAPRALKKSILLKSTKPLERNTKMSCFMLPLQPQLLGSSLLRAALSQSVLHYPRQVGCRISLQVPSWSQPASTHPKAFRIRRASYKSLSRWYSKLEKNKVSPASQDWATLQQTYTQVNTLGLFQRQADWHEAVNKFQRASYLSIWLASP